MRGGRKLRYSSERLCFTSQPTDWSRRRDGLVAGAVSSMTVLDLQYSCRTKNRGPGLENVALKFVPVWWLFVLMNCGTESVSSVLEGMYYKATEINRTEVIL